MPNQEINKINYNGTTYNIQALDAETVNGFNVSANVPPDAQFTDTTYSVDAAAGLTLDANNVISISAVPVSHGGTGTTSLTSGSVLIGNGTSTISLRGIDTTAGGTSSSSSLITSGAVYDGLSLKSDAGHIHTVSEISDLKFDGTYNSSTNKAATIDTVTTAVAAVTASTLGLGKALKFIGFSTGTMSDGQTTTPTISGMNSYTPATGDVVIDKNSSFEYVYTTANKWERLGPDGDYITAGTQISYTPAGTISNNGDTVNYTPSGSISTQSFYGTSGEVSVEGTANGSIAITTSTSGTKNFTPQGSVTSTFYGATTTFSFEGSTSGISADSVSFKPTGTITTSNGTANYTPGGTVTINGQPESLQITGTASGTISISSSGTGTKNFTPKGTVTSTFYGSASTITLSGQTSNVGVASHTFTPGGSISSSTTGTTNYTPTGTIGISGEATGTPAGDITVTTSTSGTKNYTPAGSVTTSVSVGTTSIYPVATAGTSPVLSSTVSNEILSFTWNPGAPTTLETTAVNAVTSINSATSTFSGTAVNISASFAGRALTSLIESATATFYGTPVRLSFTGSSTTLAHSVTQGHVEVSGDVTPTGTISSTFAGTATVLSAAFSGNQNTWIVSWPNLSATFTGTGANLIFSGNTTTITPTLRQGSISGTATITPTGTVGSTFSGTSTVLKATFTGSQFTATGNFTPTGTIQVATFTGAGAKLKFTGTTTQLSFGA